METTKLNQAIAPTFNLLKLTFGIVPIVAGLDKFTNLLTQWDSYISPSIAVMLPVSPSAFMMIVGIVEIAAGVIVLLRPAIGGLIVAGWLTVVAISLIVGLNHLDVAVRDLVMAVGAFSFAKIAKLVG
ncbi:MAG TPA: hypothetical protein VL728_05895 [Cyclobacteriaceae bacterium]|jgi:hypothetical protein|nr:hypothetical protein [Cyclobacteriaceae bacterium]